MRKSHASLIDRRRSEETGDGSLSPPKIPEESEGGVLKSIGKACRIKGEVMVMMFEPMSKDEFLEAVDRGIAQAKNGQRQDAHEALDEITTELEAGYNAMRAVQIANSNRWALGT